MLRPNRARQLLLQVVVATWVVSCQSGTVPQRNVLDPCQRVHTRALSPALCGAIGEIDEVGGIAKLRGLVAKPGVAAQVAANLEEPNFKYGLLVWMLVGDRLPHLRAKLLRTLNSPDGPPSGLVEFPSKHQRALLALRVRPIADTEELLCTFTRDEVKVTRALAAMALGELMLGGSCSRRVRECLWSVAAGTDRRAQRVALSYLVAERSFAETVRACAALDGGLLGCMNERLDALPNGDALFRYWYD